MDFPWWSEGGLTVGSKGESQDSGRKYSRC